MFSEVKKFNSSTIGLSRFLLFDLKNVNQRSVVKIPNLDNINSVLQFVGVK